MTTIERAKEIAKRLRDSGFTGETLGYSELLEELVSENELLRGETTDTPVAWYHSEDYKTWFTTDPDKDLVGKYWNPLYKHPKLVEYDSFKDWFYQSESYGFRCERFFDDCEIQEYDKRCEILKGWLEEAYMVGVAANQK